MRRSGSYLLLLSALLSSCASRTRSAACTGQKHEVYLYVTNLSFVDTLARVKVVVDDSVYLQGLQPRSHSPSDFYKHLPLCAGPHRLHLEFGRFVHDTTLVVDTTQSILMDMHYMPGDPLVLTPNGITVTQLVRDGRPAID
jgi:hypothetical protein